MLNPPAYPRAMVIARIIRRPRFVWLAASSSGRKDEPDGCAKHQKGGQVLRWSHEEIEQGKRQPNHIAVHHLRTKAAQECGFLLSPIDSLEIVCGNVGLKLDRFAVLAHLDLRKWAGALVDHRHWPPVLQPRVGAQGGSRAVCRAPSDGRAAGGGTPTSWASVDGRRALGHSLSRVRSSFLSIIREVRQCHSPLASLFRWHGPCTRLIGGA